ncbi:MAG: heme-binding domain-containing protein [Bacteroidales bacterium]|nr:heme-binding domain-containing protein [Bacteroidales bacterium]
MKKIVLGSVILLAILLFAVYNLVNQMPSKDLSLNEQVYEILTDSKCLMCHSYDAELPFYSKIPLVRRPLYQDINAALKEENLKPVMDSMAVGSPISITAVNKIEQIAIKNNMPPAKFYLVHWGTQLTDEKRQIIIDWAKEQRLKGYLANLSDTTLANKLASEPVFPILYDIPVDSAKVDLGFKLYHDTRLSVDNTVSCASCHGLETGGVDNKQYSEGVNGQLGGVNAPTVYNAVYNFVQFWDGRAANLAAQAAGPPLNPVEMASTSFDEIIAKLDKDAKFKAEFKKVYPEGFSEATITDAIQEFEKTLITKNSPFDRYMLGDETAMTPQQIAGYEKFKEYSCATCHSGVNFGGNTYELMGTRSNYFTARGTEMTLEDFGRYKETKSEYDRHKFKVPGLRNIALTAPYYHDGTLTSLKNAIIYMGEYQLNTNIPQQDVEDIEAFLNALTGEIPETAKVSK